MLLALAPALCAQPFYGVVYRPSGVEYEVLATEHFRVIYQRDLRALAVRVADVAEKAYPEVAERAGLRSSFSLPIILNGYNDASNGFVSPLPFRMEIDASPIKGKILNPRHEDWIAQVVPHELSHAAHAEIRGGLGVGAVVRFFSPDWARALNFGIPRGVTEGFAVSYESEGSGAVGRLNYSFTLMQARAAAATEPWTLSQVLDPPAFTRPFDRYYTGGGLLYDYLADSLRAGFFVNSTRFFNRWPFLGYGVALWQTTARPPWALSRQFVEYSRDTLHHQTSGSHAREGPTVLTDQEGLACRRPKWHDEQTLIAYCSGYNTDRGLYEIDATSGARELLLRRVVTEDYYLSIDSTRDEILFSEYQPLTFTTAAFVSRLVRFDVKSRRASTIGNSRRLFAPLRSGDGSILALQNAGPGTQLVSLDAEGRRRERPERSGIRILEVGPLAPQVLVALVNERGHQALYTKNLGAAGDDSMHPLLSAVHGSIYDPDVLPGGGGVVFTADPDGVPNVYLLDTSTGSVRRLTDAPFGAFEPSFSPNGRLLAYVNYTHEQYQIAVQPAAPGVPADSAFVFGGKAVQPVAMPALSLAAGPAGDPEVQPYRPFPSFLSPRSFVPVVRFRASEFSEHDRRLGPGFGASLSGTDPLQQWAYSLTGFYQENRLWGGLTLQTGTHVLRPYISLSDVPRSGIRPVGGSRARIPYEERSIEVGASVPVRLEAGTRNTSLAIGASSEYRSIRLLDSDANPVTGFDDRVTINPFVALGYKLTANPRDLIPNAGVTVVSEAEVDVKTEGVVTPSRNWRTDASVFLPVPSGTSTRLRILFGVLWRNQGSTVDVDTFLPRGYETEDVFLGRGTFLKAGAEVVQPVFWIDRGIVLIPFSLQAIYLYGFSESVGQSSSWRDAHTAVGAGAGFRLLVAHHLGIDLRLGVARLLEENEWTVTYR